MAAPEIRALVTPDRVPLRACVWNLPQGRAPRAVCVLLQGLTEFIEKYQDVADELGARGFVVVSLDWRSQGASERMAPGNRKIHVGDFDEYDIDLETLMREVVDKLAPGAATAPPLIALAHSMGAHILLRHLRRHRPRFAAAVLIATMLEINTQPYAPWFTRLVTRLFNLRRASKRFVFGSEGRDPMTLPFEQNLVTRDRARYERMQALLRAQPYLRVFGPTFGWLGAAFRSIRTVTARDYAEGIVTPVLMVGAGADRLVKTPPQAEYAKRLKDARYVEVADSEHEVLMERDGIRAQFWREFDEFVDGYLSR
jgi:lysophospholipase